MDEKFKQCYYCDLLFKSSESDAEMKNYFCSETCEERYVGCHNFRD